MVTVSSITLTTGRYPRIHMPFFMLSIYHFMLLAICTTQVKKGVKKKKKKKKKFTKNWLQGDSNPDPPNTLELKMNASVDADNLR